MNVISEVAHAFPQLAGLVAPALSVPFGDDDDRGAISSRLEKRLDGLFKHFHKHAARRAEATSRALESLSPLVDQAVSITAGRFELSIATLTVDDDGDAVINSLVIEASVLRLEATTPEGTMVLDLAGARVSLTSAEIEEGRVTGLYTRSLEVGTFGLFATDNDSFVEFRQAVATLTETRVALEAYREGELGPLAPPIEQA
jgi:hypothetical protein